MRSERGDGLLPTPESVWEPEIRGVATDALVRAVAGVVRELVLPEWTGARSSDRRPERALEAAGSWLARRSEDARRHAAAVAKACSQARKDSLGHEHRIAEAARAVATAVTRTHDAAVREALCEALAKTEEHLLYRLAVEGSHGREAEVRARVREALARHTQA